MGIGIDFVRFINQYKQTLARMSPERLDEAGPEWESRRLFFFFASLVPAVSSVRNTLTVLGSEKLPETTARLLESVTLDMTVRQVAQRVVDAYAGASLTVDYHCERNGHAYYPPPPWHEGKKCWCGSTIVRED